MTPDIECSVSAKVGKPIRAGNADEAVTLGLGDAEKACKEAGYPFGEPAKKSATEALKTLASGDPEKLPGSFKFTVPDSKTEESE